MRADPHARSRIRLPPSRSVSGTADIPGMEGTALCTSLTATTVDGQARGGPTPMILRARAVYASHKRAAPRRGPRGVARRLRPGAIARKLRRLEGARPRAPQIAEMKEAIQNGADIVEIRLDFIQDLDAAGDIPRLVQASDLPCIVTFRPSWEGGRYEGDEAERLAALRWACEAGERLLASQTAAMRAMCEVQAPRMACHPRSRPLRLATQAPSSSMWSSASLKCSSAPRATCQRRRQSSSPITTTRARQRTR